MSGSIAIKYFLLWQTIIIIRHVSPLITPFSEIHFVWDGVPPVLSFLRGPQPIFTPGVINSLNYCAYAVGCTSSPKRVRKHRGIAKLSDPQNLTSTRSWIRKGFRIYLIPALIPEAPLWIFLDMSQNVRLFMEIFNRRPTSSLFRYDIYAQVPACTGIC